MSENNSFLDAVNKAQAKLKQYQSDQLNKSTSEVSSQVSQATSESKINSEENDSMNSSVASVASQAESVASEVASQAGSVASEIVSQVVSDAPASLESAQSSVTPVDSLGSSEVVEQAASAVSSNEEPASDDDQAKKDDVTSNTSDGDNSALIKNLFDSMSALGKEIGELNGNLTTIVSDKFNKPISEEELNKSHEDGKGISILNKSDEPQGSTAPESVAPASEAPATSESAQGSLASTAASASSELESQAAASAADKGGTAVRDFYNEANARYLKEARNWTEDDKAQVSKALSAIDNGHGTSDDVDLISRTFDNYEAVKNN